MTHHRPLPPTILAGAIVLLLSGCGGESESTDPAAAADADQASTAQPASARPVTPEMLAQVPGWTADVIEQYMAQGWSFEQLVTYYQEQVAQHAQEEQH